MDGLIAGEIVKIRIRELHEEAERWRRVGHAEARRRVPARSPVDRWYLWRVVEPDPRYYGRGG
jgi:hypothetical protein